MEIMKPKPLRSDIGTLYRSDSAISAVISAVLILGLIVTATTIYQVRYVPAWKSDAECSHLSDVWADMSNLKSQIDVLSAIIVANPESHVSVSVPIKMGGGDIPVISPGKSSGALSVNYNDYDMWVDACNWSGDPHYHSGSNLTDLGSISYRSCNNYYMNQLFDYENGALILVQEDRSLMKLTPAIRIQRTNAPNISVTITAIEITGSPRTISSNGIDDVQLTADSSTRLFPSDLSVAYVNITVSTKHPEIWARYFNTTADGAGLDSSEYDVSVNGSYVLFILRGAGAVDSNDITLRVRKSTIEARLDVI
jgi:hypothetical protein